MTLTELAQKLKALDYPVAYSHFKSVQAPPFICYLVVDGDTFTADNKVAAELISVDVELYVANKDLKVEQKIKNMLNDNELPWSYDEQFIKDEGVFKCTFSITLTN